MAINTLGKQIRILVCIGKVPPTIDADGFKPTGVMQFLDQVSTVMILDKNFDSLMQLGSIYKKHQNKVIIEFALHRKILQKLHMLSDL